MSSKKDERRSARAAGGKGGGVSSGPWARRLPVEFLGEQDRGPVAASPPVGDGLGIGDDQKTAPGFGEREGTDDPLSAFDPGQVHLALVLRDGPFGPGGAAVALDVGSDAALVEGLVEVRDLGLLEGPPGGGGHDDEADVEEGLITPAPADGLVETAFELVHVGSSFVRLRVTHRLGTRSRRGAGEPCYVPVVARGPASARPAVDFFGPRSAATIARLSVLRWAPSSV